MKERDLWIVLVIVALLFTSCGAKSKVVQKEVRTQKNDIVVHETENIHTDVDLNKIVNQLSFEPVDPKIPNNVIFTNGKDTISIKGQNTRIFQKTETTDSIVQKVQVKDSSVVDKSEKESKIVDKNIESEGWNWKGLNWFVLLIIIIIALFVYYKLRK